MRSVFFLSLLCCLGGAGARAGAKYQDRKAKGSAETVESDDWTSTLSLEDLSIRCAAETTIAEKIKQAFSKCSKFSRPQTRLSSKGKKGKGKGKGKGKVKVKLRLITFFTHNHKGQRKRKRKRWKEMCHC